MPSAKPGVSTTESSVSTAKTAVAASSTMLRPQGHREEERECRDGRQATHTN
jgi:hypothetical protein